MDPPRQKIKKQFTEKLAHFLKDKDEGSLADAYELGRSAVSAGMGGLELVNLYHEALLQVNSGLVDKELDKNLKLALDFLTECLAPVEMRSRGFQDLIKRQEEQNRILQEEVERRIESEEELRKSKEHFKHLIENALDIITVLNYDGTIRYESPSLERILGYDPVELIGESAFDYVHPDDLEQIQKKLSRVMRSPDKMDSAEFRFRHKDGSWRYLESIAKNVVDAREGPGIIVNSRDVTERVKAWEQLEQSEEQLSTAQQIGRLGSWEWDINENTLRWSAELCRIYGITPENQPQTYDEYLEYIHPEDRNNVDKQIRKAYEEKSEFSFVHRLIRSDGAVKTLSCRGEIITDENANPVKMIGTGQDITTLKEAEQKLRTYSEQLKKLTAKQEKVREDERIRIAREIHDELGQMLTVLKMDISIALKRAENKLGNEIVSEFSKEIDKIIDRIDTIIHSVQRITTELRPEVLDDLGLKEALEWQAQEFEDRAQVKLEFTNNASSINNLDDERSTAIFRIFQETLTNILRHAQASKVQILLEEDDEYLILNVKDNGKGISQKDIEYTNSLGIIGMKERSNFLGGSIDFEGEPGEGTSVTLKIPRAGT